MGQKSISCIPRSTAEYHISPMGYESTTDPESPRGFVSRQSSVVIHGVVESWSRGVVESWSRGVVESWSHGVVENRKRLEREQNENKKEKRKRIERSCIMQFTRPDQNV
ncbi:hypothetical protein L228DRAFT_43741 [Xylona heveae TC161]|uniref:Uncharacterized protein n=1 Tax=Xylona heveae (strain CBS 132557 / TC161) TaxID=1328760 RepID=A0A164ZSJ8_XYLHT|nr:hypothetical protein L228DRAFT_43741 [Xylona heveae TC161]KZF19456.1 hypothetical protein L228DRAFT_43741 [Xylona heveae TC161]